MEKRTAIIVKKDLPPGQLANIAAILMAEISRVVPETMADEFVVDLDGLSHAKPQFSIVILKANSGEQLKNTVVGVRASEPELVVTGFSEIGQSLNNLFTVYKEKVANSTTEATSLVGIAICGDDAAVRRATKKFSVM